MIRPDALLAHLGDENSKDRQHRDVSASRSIEVDRRRPCSLSGVPRGLSLRRHAVGAPPGGLRVTELFRGHAASLALVAFLSMLSGFAEAAFLVMVTRTGFALAEGVPTVTLGFGVDASLGRALAAALVVVLVRLVSGMLAAWYSARVSAAFTASMRRELSDAFVASSFAAQHGERQGRLQELLTTFTSQGSALVQSVTSATKAGCNLAALLFVSVFVDARSTLTVIGALVLFGFVLRPLRSAVKRRARQAAERGMHFATALTELSQLGVEMHVFGAQAKVKARVDHLISRTEESRRRLQFYKSALPVIYVSFAYVAILGALAVMSRVDTIDIASAGAVVVVMLRSLNYGQNLQTSSADFSAALPFVGTYQAELDRYRSSQLVDGDVHAERIDRVRLDDVSFEYTPGRPVLQHVTFEISPREIVGVVGPSGSGKSTLVQLLLGLRTPTSGEVLADGRPIKSLTRQTWVRKVTFVPQEARLIAGTVADNIRFMRDDVDDVAIEAAARLANLHQDVVGFSGGYEREVGEQGSHLSGGQKQRLVIARALVESPDLLILDEPTSALDVKSESLIRETLLTLRERMTIIVIAHRLSTLDICDRIMVIQDGEMKGFDTPENLEESSDFYREALVLSGLR